jgi:hypothetical protein
LLADGNDFFVECFGEQVNLVFNACVVPLEHHNFLINFRGLGRNIIHSLLHKVLQRGDVLLNAVHQDHHFSLLLLKLLQKALIL